jgi:FKBP-type peptidyl-prolyl cis-trans isomerase FkpA
MPLPPRFRLAFEPPPHRARHALLIVAMAMFAGAACGPIPTRTRADGWPPVANAAGKSDARVTDLHIIEVGLGAGAEALPGMFVVVHYTGWLYDPDARDRRGAQFDSSADRNAAFGFYVDTGKVIRGWDEGIPGMKIGGRRTLVVPPAMAYGAAGVAGIPPNATLVFDIELLDARTSRIQSIE